MRPRAFWLFGLLRLRGLAALFVFEVSYGVHLYTGHDA